MSNGDATQGAIDVVGSGDAEVLSVPEPAACGGRLDADQRVVPEWLAVHVDGHLQRSASPWATARLARTICAHVDWATVWATEPALFIRRAQVGLPPLPVLWQAQAVLAELGCELQVEVQFEDLGGEPGLAIYGVGVAGVLTEPAWREAASRLTTCCCTIRIPRRDWSGEPAMPSRPPTPAGAWPLSTSVAPLEWWLGEWQHTWWSYPMTGPMRPDCTCAGRQPSGS